MSAKKAQGLSINTIIIAIIVLVVLVVLVMVFSGYFGKWTGLTGVCETQGGTCQPEGTTKTCANGKVKINALCKDGDVVLEDEICCSNQQIINFD